MAAKEYMRQSDHETAEARAEIERLLGERDEYVQRYHKAMDEVDRLKEQSQIYRDGFNSARDDLARVRAALKKIEKGLTCSNDLTDVDMLRIARAALEGRG